MKLLKWKSKLSLSLFLIIGVFVNLIQAAYTGALFDETYYWYFSQSLDWGYFDHPPMVALFIRLSDFLFHQTLGIRFFVPFLYAGTLWLICKMIDHPEKKDNLGLFIILILATPLYTAYGFFMLPDTPILFFSALLMYLFKRFLTQPKLGISLLMALSMAAIMYSKYHGAILILALIFSKSKVLKKPVFWLSVFIAIALYLPHLWWLYKTDFVTLNYHLLQRTRTDFEISRVLEHIGSQLAVLGFLFVVFFTALVQSFYKKGFIKSCFWIVVTFLAFFFVNSFTRNTQAQWTIVSIVPFLIIVFDFLIEKKTWRRWFYILAGINIFLISLARLGLLFPWLLPINYESHNNQTWINELKEKSKGLPVVFENSYRDASMYRFYTGIPTLSNNNLAYRKSQYDIDSSEHFFQHKKVAFVSPWTTPKKVDFKYKSKDKSTDLPCYFIEDYRSARKLVCLMDQKFLVPKKDQVYNFTLKNPYAESVALKDLVFKGVYTKKNDRPISNFDFIPIEMTKNPNLVLNAKGSLRLSFKLSKMPKSKEAANFRIAIAEYGFYAGFQGVPIPIKYADN